MENNIAKAKTKQQIADEYGICTRTLNKWLLEHNIFLKRGLISPREQDLIESKLGSLQLQRNQGSLGIDKSVQMMRKLKL